MPFKPNYRQQRNERTRAKQAKAEEKLRERQAARAGKKDDEADAPAEEDKDSA